MFQLVLTVMSVSLLCVTMIGGLSYMSNTFALRQAASVAVIAGDYAFETALSGYRMANNGAMPTTASWTSDLASYFPIGQSPSGGIGAVAPPINMSWSYNSTSKYICLYGVKISSGTQAGLIIAVKNIPNATLAKVCGATTANAVWDGTAAITILLQAGG